MRLGLSASAVAAHYASFDVDKAVKMTVSKPRAVYVSYRKGDQVYWTARKLMLAEGETLLTDGRNEMRARCANRISDVPQLPVELNAPSAEELDSIVGVSMDLGGLGLDDPAYSATGSINGLGLALAGNEAPSDSNAAGASRGRVSTGHSRPGNSTSGSGEGSPNTAAPPQNQGGNTSNTPGEPTMSGSKPSTVPPEVPPRAPGGEPPQGSPGTPLLPIQNEPPEWPPGTLPEEPGKDVQEVPEPGTLWLSAAAFAAMLLLRRRAQNRGQTTILEPSKMVVCPRFWN